MSTDLHLERAVVAEFRLRERRARRREASHGGRLLAERLHHGRRDLLEHLGRVAFALPGKFRAVAWLHHASAADVTPRALSTAGLTDDEAAAVELFDAPGRPGLLARVVTRAAIEDRLDGAPPSGETLTALRLLLDSGLAA